MNILVACEESGRVTEAFRKKGHNAFSCDLLNTSGNLPQYHICDDVLFYLSPLPHKDCETKKIKYDIRFTTQTGQRFTVPKWDMLIAFPPCTYLSKAGACNNKRRHERIAKGWEAREFFMILYSANIERICIENPIPQAKFMLPPRSMRLQPYEYGHPYSKFTCLWLKNLPPLLPTVCPDFSVKYKSWCAEKGAGRKDRAIQRSKTFQGVADAMAEQWGSN